MTFFDELASLISHQQDPPIDPNTFGASRGAPSVSIAVLDHGEVEARCFSAIGNDVNTRFQACSISKPVTGMAVMKLVEQGKLRLEDKIADLLPETVVEALGPPALVHEITFEHILSHTAGLSTGGFGGYTSDPPSAEEVIVGKYPVNSQPVRVVEFPGRTWSYSGGGFTLLQIALEKITSKPFPQLMDDLVLRPLQMTSSCYGTPENQDNLATAYWNGVTPSDHWHYFAELAAAGLWTTPSDLLKVIHAVQKSLKGEEDAFLKQGTAKRMLTEIQSDYGLSWVAPKTPGTSFGHNGANDPGYRCLAVGIADLLGEEEKESPNEECGIVVMTNASNGIAPAFTALQTIAFMKGWPELDRLSSGMPFVTPLKVVGSKVDAEWKKWEGAWSHGWSVEAGKDGSPQARWGTLKPVQLLPAAILAQVFDEGESLDLVLDGVGGLMRLGWRDGERSIEYWDGLTFEVTKLPRASS